MLDFIGMVIVAALMMLVVNDLITFMDVPRVAKITLAAVIGIWIGLAAAAAGARWLTISRPVRHGRRLRTMDPLPFRLDGMEFTSGRSHLP